jgi:hypothetical protein
VALADTQNGHLGRIDDGREVAPANAAQAGDREAGARHLGRRQLAVARLLGQLAHFLADLQDALLVGILDHRHHQAVGRVGRKADMEVLLVDQGVAVQRAVELGVFLQRRHAGLDQKGQHRHLDAGLLVLLVGRHAEGFQIGDVGVVMVGDGGNHDRVAQQVGATDLLDARQLLALDGAELGEVDLGPGDQAQLGAAAAGLCRRRLGRLGLGLRGTCHHRPGEGLHIGFGDAALGPAAFDLIQRHAQFARELAHRWRCVRQPHRRAGGVMGGHSSSGRRGRCSRCRGRCGGGRRRRCGGHGWCDSTPGAFQNSQQIADVHGVAELDLQLAHHAGGRRRDFHRRLVGLHRDQALLQLDGVAGLDEHLDHRKP